MPHNANKPRRRAVTVCKHWLRGLCKKGDACEFLHEYDLRKMPECWWFVKWGWCANGEECLYRHTSKDGRKNECPEYLRGFCKRGPYCPFKHVRRAACVAYLAGYCPDGPECPRGQWVSNNLCLFFLTHKTVQNQDYRNHTHSRMQIHHLSLILNSVLRLGTWVIRMREDLGSRVDLAQGSVVSLVKVLRMVLVQVVSAMVDLSRIKARRWSCRIVDQVPVSPSSETLTRSHAIVRTHKCDVDWRIFYVSRCVWV